MTFINKKNRKLLLKNQLSTITVDIFDTILIRKIYPENRQFFLHAQACQKLLESHFHLHLNPYQLVDLRIYCRNIIDTIQQEKKNNPEARLREVFSLLIEYLSCISDSSINAKTKKLCLQYLIEQELEGEKKALRLNIKLIEELRFFKQQGLKIYFISDMYLESSQISELLKYFKCLDIFDGGISSCDVRVNKGSGKLYKKIIQKSLIPDFNPLKNLHIGDNSHGDGTMAILHGSHIQLVSQWHHQAVRPLKMKFYGWSWFLSYKRYEHRQKRLRKHCLKEHLRPLNPHQQILFRLGYRLGPAIIYYLNFLHLYSFELQAPLVFLSSEGHTLKKWLKTLGAPSKGVILEKFNRINTLRCFAYLALSKPKIKYSQAIIHLFFHGEGKNGLKDLLKSLEINPADLGLTELTLNHMPAEFFIEQLLQHLKKSDHLRLKKSYQKLLRELDTHRLLKQRHLILSDVGWNGTIQILLEQILSLLKKENTTQGVYIGHTAGNIFGLKTRKNQRGLIYPYYFHPLYQKGLVEEIWEYVLTFKNKSDAKLSLIHAGIQAAINDYRYKHQQSPNQLFSAYKRELIKQFNYPNRKEIVIIGSIHHDAGFGSEVKRSIVDFTLNKPWLWQQVFANPELLKNIYLGQYWPQGFIRWYFLDGFKPFIPLANWFYKKRRWFFKS